LYDQSLKTREIEPSRDILLIPPVSNPVFRDAVSDFIPVGLLVLVSSLQKNGLQADIYQPDLVMLDESDYQKVALEYLKRMHPLPDFQHGASPFRRL